MNFKNKKILAKILMVSAIGVSSNAAIAKNPLLHKADVRVMGPGGEVLVYYKDGSDIVVKNCGKDYPRVTEQSDCKGTENRVPVGVFKQVLRSQFLIGSADKLKPMTAEELKAYGSADKSGTEKLQAQEKELDAKLASIKEFLAEGAGGQTQTDKDATEKLLKDVRAQLELGKANGAAVEKVNNLINDIVDNKISDSRTLHKVADGRDGDQAIFNLLQQFDASKGECGTDAILNGTKEHYPGDDNALPPGTREATWLLNVIIPDARADVFTVEDRIKNCSALPKAIKKTQKNVIWNLVARSRDRKTGKFYEVWRDSKSGLLWGDRLDKRYSHYDAIALGLKGNVVSESACNSDNGKTANAGIGEKKFGLPTIEEYLQAEENGVREVLQNMDDFFWSASRYPNDTDNARGFFGSSGYFVNDPRDDYGSVRCVGR
jgi:hypothetical protein